MYCTNCGAQNDDDAVFCTSCGNALDAPAAIQDAGMASEANSAMEANTPAETNIASEINTFAVGNATSDVYTTVPANTQSDSSSKSKTPLFIGIAVVAVIVVITAAIGIFMFMQNQAKHEAHPVTIQINTAGYSDQDTRIPVRVVGNDLDNKSVDTTFFVNAAGEGIDLPKGTYELSVPASPLTANGILYKDYEPVFSLTLPDDLENGTTVDASQIVIDMEKSTALEQTQEMIDAAYEYAIQDPDQATKAEELRDTANQAHEDAVAAEEAARQAALARQNPSSVNAVNGDVTLKGTLVRRERSTDDTGMGWASVNYVLEFENPVAITYRTASGSIQTETFTWINIGASEVYFADENTDLSNVSEPKFQQYVGKFVAVTGPIFDGGTMHTYGYAQFGECTITVMQLDIRCSSS